MSDARSSTDECAVAPKDDTPSKLSAEVQQSHCCLVLFPVLLPDLDKEYFFIISCLIYVYMYVQQKPMLPFCN